MALAVLLGGPRGRWWKGRPDQKSIFRQCLLLTNGFKCTVDGSLQALAADGVLNLPHRSHFFLHDLEAAQLAAKRPFDPIQAAALLASRRERFTPCSL